MTDQRTPQIKRLLPHSQNNLIILALPSLVIRILYYVNCIRAIKTELQLLLRFVEVLTLCSVIKKVKLLSILVIGQQWKAAVLNVLCFCQQVVISWRDKPFSLLTLEIPDLSEDLRTAKYFGCLNELPNIIASTLEKE